MAGDIPAASLPDRSWRGRLGRALDPRIPHTNGLVAPNGATGLLGPLVAEADLVWFGRLRSASVFPAGVGRARWSISMTCQAPKPRRRPFPPRVSGG